MEVRLLYGVRLLFVYCLLFFAAAAPAGAKPAPGAVPQPGGSKVHILAFGDSLTAGYGLAPGLGFAPQLEKVLRRNGIAAHVVDAGVSGSTTAEGRARLAWTLDGLDKDPHLAIVALGGNDMLRGLSPQQTRSNLEAIVAELRRRGIRVLVAGMLAAPNMGPDFSRDYNALFPAVARRHDADFYPFFLAGVAGNRAFLLEDGIHPNFQGIKQMVSAIAPRVVEALP